MPNLNIPASQSTPSINTDIEIGRITIKGDSYPENSFEFFANVINWIEEFIANQTIPLNLELNIIYMNTSSVKAVMDILDLLESAHQDQKPVKVCWFYDVDNDRVKELAEEFFEDYTFPFEIIAND